MLLGLYICTIRARVSILQLGSRARFSSLSIFFSLSLLPTSWSPALLSIVTAGHNSPGRRPSRTLCRGRLLLSVPGWPPTTQDTCPAAISISPLSPGSYLLAADHSLPQVGPLLCRGRLPPTASRPLCRGCLLLSVLGWPPTTHGPCPACLDRCRPAAIWISPPSPGSFLLAADLPLPQAGPLLYCGRPPLTASRPSRPPSSPPVPAPLARRLRFPRRLLLRPWRLSLMAPPPPFSNHGRCPHASPPRHARLLPHCTAPLLQQTSVANLHSTGTAPCTSTTPMAPPAATLPAGLAALYAALAGVGMDSHVPAALRALFVDPVTFVSPLVAGLHHATGPVHFSMGGVPLSCVRSTGFTSPATLVAPGFPASRPPSTTAQPHPRRP